MRRLLIDRIFEDQGEKMRKVLKSNKKQTEKVREKNKIYANSQYDYEKT